jgi:uncharacterized membrane protein
VVSIAALMSDVATHYVPNRTEPGASSIASTALAGLAPRIDGAAMDFTSPANALTLLTRAALMLLLEGTSVGMAVALGRQDSLASFAQSNEMLHADRTALVMSAVVGALVPLALAAVFLIARPSHRSALAVERLARVLAPAMMALPLPFFFDWRVFNDHDLMLVVGAMLYGIALERALRVSFTAIGTAQILGPLDALTATAPRFFRWLPAILVGALALSYGAYLSYYTVLNHVGLRTTSYDLAIFDNIFWNLLRGKWFKAAPVLGPTGSHIQYHATFIAYLFAPIYALRQNADTILVIQGMVVGLGAIPIYLLARRRLHSAVMAIAIAYVYAIHGPVHGPVFYDFHFITMEPFWVGWVLYFFDTRRRGWLLTLFILSLLVREDISATLAGAALFYLLSGERPVWAFFGGLSAAVYFVLIKFVIMPAHARTHDETFTWIFQGMIPKGEVGFGAVVKTALTNPVFTMEKVLIPEKIAYVLKMAVPLLLLPYRHARAWVLVLPASVFTLLSTGYDPVVSTAFQYTSNWTPYLFFGAIVVIASWRTAPDAQVRQWAAVGAMVVTATAVSYNEGCIFQHNNFKGGFGKAKFVLTDTDKRNYADLNSLIALIPKNASVAATEHEAPHVSARENCYTMRMDAYDAEYLLVSLAEARGGSSLRNMEKALRTGHYGFVSQKGNFALWSKAAPHDKDAGGAKLLGVTL